MQQPIIISLKSIIAKHLGTFVLQLLFLSFDITLKVGQILFAV